MPLSSKALDSCLSACGNCEKMATLMAAAWYSGSVLGAAIRPLMVRSKYATLALTQPSVRDGSSASSCISLTCTRSVLRIRVRHIGHCEPSRDWPNGKNSMLPKELSLPDSSNTARMHWLQYTWPHGVTVGLVGVSRQIEHVSPSSLMSAADATVTVPEPFVLTLPLLPDLAVEEEVVVVDKVEEVVVVDVGGTSGVAVADGIDDGDDDDDDDEEVVAVESVGDEELGEAVSACNERMSFSTYAMSILRSSSRWRICSILSCGTFVCGPRPLLDVTDAKWRSISSGVKQPHAI